jgi:hypothetical protein
MSLLRLARLSVGRSDVDKSLQITRSSCKTQAMKSLVVIELYGFNLSTHFVSPIQASVKTIPRIVAKRMQKKPSCVTASSILAMKTCNALVLHFHATITKLMPLGVLH